MRGGFTLIELLTVIAIIGILAAILIPVVARARQSASKAYTTSSLRQIGTAVHLFANDHDGMLPGMHRIGADGRPDGNYALGGGQGPYGNLATRMSLQSPDQLGPYIDVRLTTLNGTQRLYTPLLDRPAWSKSGTAFLRGTTVRGFDGQLRYPGGHPSGVPSMRLDNLESEVDTPRRWFLIEIDQTTPTEVDVHLRNAGWYNELPETPVHGNGWIALFYAGNIGFLAPGDQRLDNFSMERRR